MSRRVPSSGGHPGYVCCGALCELRGWLPAYAGAVVKKSLHARKCNELSVPSSCCLPPAACLKGPGRIWRWLIRMMGPGGFAKHVLRCDMALASSSGTVLPLQLLMVGVRLPGGSHALKATGHSQAHERGRTLTFAPCSVPSRIMGGRCSDWGLQHNAAQATEPLASKSCCCTHVLPALPSSACCILYQQPARGKALSIAYPRQGGAHHCEHDAKHYHALLFIF